MTTKAIPTIRPIQVTWTNLLHAAALADAAVLLYMLVTTQDTLALALAAALLAGLALLRFRNGLIGLIVLALVFADTAFWTVPGAVANFINREPLSDLLLPSYLGWLYLVGLAAALGAFRDRRRPAADSTLPRWLGAASVAVLVIVSVAALLVTQRAGPVTVPSALPLSAKNMAFTANVLTAAGQPVTIHFTNEDLWWHTFTIDELGVNENVAMGAERAITFDAPPGEYRFYCAIPGHAAIGMEGTLVVGEGE